MNGESIKGTNHEKERAIERDGVTTRLLCFRFLLVLSLERWNSLTLVLIQSGVDDSTVSELDLVILSFLMRKSVCRSHGEKKV